MYREMDSQQQTSLFLYLYVYEIDYFSFGTFLRCFILFCCFNVVVIVVTRIWMTKEV
ncbi:hypothetical protein Hdeb2414_s0666g00932581 [Helianthus debilis subsp. tardiflorus]